VNTTFLLDKETTMTTHAPALLALSTGLRDARERRKISLRELARKLGIHPANLSNWELGTTGPTPATVARILGFLQAKGTEYKQLMALAEHIGDANWVDQSTSPLIDLLGTYEQLSSRIVEWAPFCVPDLLQAPSSTLSDGGTQRSDLELFHRQLRRQAMNDGQRRYVFIVGDHALRTADGEPTRDDHLPAAAHIDVRVLPSSTAPEPFTVFETGRKPIAVALKHTHCTTFLTDKDLLTSYHRTAKAFLRKTQVPALANQVRAS
jgi:transcriptional regulator with XRE-family HTH domain